MSSAPLPVEEKLDSEFRNAVQNSSDCPRYFVVGIKEEKLICLKVEKGSSDVGVDFDSLQEVSKEEGKEGCYILFRKTITTRNGCW